MKALFSHPLTRASISVLALLSVLVVSLFTSIGVQPAGATPWYARDQFGTAAYTNNDGSVNWNTDWSDINDGTSSATAGNIQVTGGVLRVCSRCVTNDADFEGAQRSVNLSMAASATLSFYFTSANLEAADTVSVDVYNGTSWTSLETLSGSSTIGRRTYNISAYRNAATAIRFQITANFDQTNETMSFDNVEVAYTVGGSQTSTSVLQTVQTYYVPVPEDQALKAMVEIENGGPSNAPESPTFVYISITVNTDGTVVYYDHWEDDFETTINAPTQDTTDVWGDNNTANGVPPGYATDVLNQGDIIILNNRVDVGASWPTPRVVKYDGGDKLAATQAISVTRTSWASVTGTLHGGSVEMLNTEVWGERFDVPADYTVNPTVTAAPDQRDFEYAGLAVMARLDGTQVYRNGSLIATINEGQSYLFENIGGTNTAAANYIVMGDRITTNADHPVQANFLTGDIATNYSSSWLTLYPYDLLSNAYYSVVPGFATPARVTRVYLENPNSSAITVNYQGYGDATASTVTINAYSANWVTLSTTADKGYRFWTTGSPASKFQAISIIDSENQASDWGYTLIPENQLTQQAQVGWGYGQDPTAAYSENGSPIWVIAVDKTSPYTTSRLNVCADYDGDGLGAFTDVNGHRYDELVQLYHLQQARIYDSDGDQTGMLLYLCNGSESNGDYTIAAAWGQDPTTATAGAPGLDVGTSVPPLPNFTAIKDAELTNDLNGDGKFDLGDSFEYQIVINNTGALPIPAGTITVEDIVPQYTTYVPNSTRVDGVLVADNSSLATAFPLDEGGLLINKTLSIEGRIIVTFQVTIDNDLPGSTNIQNDAQVSGLDLEYDPQVQIVVDPPQKIGDFIWLDLDGDSAQDPGEPGMPGVTVRLYAADNTTLLATTTTNSNGQYTFSGLTASTTYHVRVDPATLPGGLTQTGDPDSTLDNRHQVALGTTPYYTADFGYQGNVSIGDFVWYDIDRDGVQDGGSEVGLSNVTVNLIWAGPDGNLSTTADNKTFTTVTNSSGIYGFTHLPAGTYRVDLDETSLPSNYGVTTTDPRDTGALAAGANHTTADFGAAPGATISDFVWNDLDGDGTQDAGEGGIPDVRVYIDADGDNIYDIGERYETTDSNGNYAITNLAPGTYAVRVDTITLPASSTQTYDLDGIATSHEANVAVTAGQVRTDADFGYQLGVLSITKSSDAGSVVLPGDIITYTLLVRNNSGTTQSGIVVTDPLPGGTTYVSGSTAVTHPGITNGTYRDNFGTAAYNNSNGTQSWTSNSWSEIGETTNPSAGQIQITGGELRFQGPTNGSTYSIEREMDLSGATSATLTYDCRASLNHEATDTVFLAASSNGGSSWTDLGSITLNTINGANCAASFESFNILSYVSANTRIRFTHTASANDEYFYVDNLQVQYSTAATTRDNIVGGAYTDLYNGTPPVLVHQNDAYSLTNGQSMTITYQVTVNDSVALSSIDNTASVTSTQQITPQEASVSDPLPRSAVGDYVWLDEDGDGDQDAGEAGISNVRVTLTGQDADGNAVSLSTYTDSNGRYVFTNLVPSDSTGYTIGVDTSSLPAGLAANPTYDENGVGTAHTTSFVLNAATEHMTADFGYNWAATSHTNNTSGTGAIGDRVWVDDNDGIQEPGEPGLYNVTVQLLTAGTDGIFGTGDDVVAATTTTGYDGSYIFDGLAAGSYQVRIPTTPTGYTQSGDPDQPGALCTSCDGRTTTPIVLAPGDVYVNADFGYYGTANAQRRTIGDTLWLDADRDNAIDAGEPLLGCVSVALIRDLNGNGTWNVGEPIIATDITDVSGQYLFTGIDTADGTGTDDYLVWVNDSGNVLAGLTPVYDSDGTGTSNLSAVTNMTDASNLLQDFGYAPAGHDAGESLIGDTIFYDNNANGTFQAGEGLEGVRVNLYTDVNSNGVWDAGDILMASTTTNENGQYFFGRLTTNGVIDFVVRIDTATLPTGVTNTVDPNTASPGDNQSAVTNMAANSANYTQDFGYRDTSNPNSISGTLWRDTNADGDLDSSEATRFAGVTVVLRDSDGDVVATATTNASGNYSFNNLPDGNYTVDVTDDASVLGGYWKSNGAAATDNNSQADPLTVTLSGNTNITYADFGYYREMAAVGDYVWNDLNGNGIQESGEPAIAGVTVTLTITWPGSGSTTVLTTTTNASGYYNFGNLLLDEDFNGASGSEPTFLVTFAAPSGYMATAADQGGDDALDSDGLTEAAAPLKGETITTIDSGFVERHVGSIGNYVWLDEDGEGDQDAGEMGVPNVRVFLDTDNDGAYDTGETYVYTDADGGYIFKGLNAGTYNLTVDLTSLPGGLTNFTYDEDDGTSSPEGRTPVTLASEQEYLTADFSLNWSTANETNTNTGTGAIGDRVWIDDGDGVQEPGEPGMGGVSVALITAGTDGIFGTSDDVTAATTTTNAAGNYIFDGLSAGSYVVRVNNGTAPSGYAQTGDPDGTLDHSTTAPILLGPGDVFVNADFGYQPTAGNRWNIGDTLWLDTNRDGVVDAATAEPRLAGVTVALVRDTNGDGSWDADGADNLAGTADDEPVIAQDITDGNGEYLFTNLPNTDGVGTDDYLVWVNDTQNVLADLMPVYDSDGVGTLNISAVTDLGAANNLAQDFGYAPAGHDAGEGLIGDMIFYDNNNSGSYDAGEGLEGVRVNLYQDTNADGNYDAGEPWITSTVTNENGQYFFGGLAAGVYVVRVDTATLPAGVTNTVDAGDATLNQGGVNLAPGGTDLTLDFGYRDTSNPNSVSGTLWRDTNADGDLDGSEAARFAGVTVVLRDSSGDIVGTTMTDVSGNYSFNNLPNGNYTVDVTDEGNLLHGYWKSSGAAATDNNSQSDPLVVTLSGNTNITYADFGYYRETTAVSDLVWLDRDNDGIQDADEPGIPGVLVTLTALYPDSSSASFSALTTTGGLYSFGNLLLDEDYDGVGSGEPTYSLIFTTPPGITASPATQGSDRTVDSNGATPTVSGLVEGQTDTTYDSGFYTVRMDLGDLPNNYRTLFRPGPAHVIFPDNENNDTHAAGADGRPDVIAGGPIAVWLGSIVDVEADGQPDLSAFLDDTDHATDDEDGLSLAASGWIAGASSTGTITVNSSQATRVYYALWIDWGNNGSFLDTNDGFYNGYQDTASPATTPPITIAVPGGAGGYMAGTNVYMRLRASTTPLTQSDFEGTVVNGEVEDYWYQFDAGGTTTTPITLSYFYAQQDGTTVNFSWSTATETGNAGFNLYIEKDGQLVLANSELIKSNVIDSLERQDYSFSAQVRGRVFYIEDVSVLGETILHGPFEIGQEYGERLAADKIDLAAIKAETVAKNETRQKAIKQEIDVPDPVRSESIRGPVVSKATTRAPKPTRTPTPTRTLKPTQTPKVQRTASPTATVIATHTATPAATFTPTFEPTVTPTPTVEATFTVDVIDTPSAATEDVAATATEESTATPQPTFTTTTEPTSTDEPAATATVEPSVTPTLVLSPASAPTAYATAVPVDPSSLQLTTTLYLKVRKTGIYRVTYESLRDAGLDLAGVPTSKLTLINHDQMIPIYVYSPDQAESFGPGGFMEFYGKALDTLYTDTNVYTVQVSSASVPRISTMSAIPQTGIAPETSYTYTLKVNNQKVYSSTLPGTDTWYDTAMQVAKTQKSWSFTFQVSGLADPSAESALDMVVKGYTSSTVNPDHHMLVKVNGILVANETFDGIVEHSLRASLPPGTLVEGTNTLQLILPADTGASSEVVLLDRYSITYPRIFQAQSGELTFASSGNVFNVTGLSSTNVVAYRLLGNGIVRLDDIQVQVSGSEYSAAFSGTTQADTYLITTAEAVKAPALEAVRAKADLNRSADYLIISHPDFISGLQPLIAARQAQGLTVNVVNVNDLYAQYSGGVFDPMAIKTYVAYAANNLGTQYVLLVGGDTYDYRNYLGRNSVSFLPSLYVATGPLARAIPSDPLYADIDNDNVPDLAIGRFPVRTTAELTMLVSKTLAYSNKGYGRTSVFVSDVKDGDISFKSISAQMAAGLPADWSVTHIDLDDMDTATAKANLLTSMNQGPALVTFVGHSGPQAWTFSNLLTNADAAALTNTGKPFVVVQWGCWNTYYVDPIYNYLVQKFLFSGDRGAAAVIGATTLADSESERILGELLTPRLTTPGMTIGQALRDAKRELAKTHPDMLDMLLGFSLMGDPALVIQP